MGKISEALADRLNALTRLRVIAGWQEGGGHNAGLSKRPLPALIFPVNGSGASTYYSEASMADAVSLLELFGPIQMQQVPPLRSWGCQDEACAR